LKIKAFLGNYLFSSLYQQNPQKPEDNVADVGMIRKIETVPNPQLVRWCRAWDFAATKKRRSDYTVGSLIGTDGIPGSTLARTYIGDMVRGQWKPAEVEEKLVAAAQADGPNIPIVIEQEPGAAGKAHAEHLATNVLRGYIVQIEPSMATNKIAKANPYVAAVSHGRVSIVKADWNGAHEDELREWPFPPHDDTVDSVALGYNYLHQTKMLIPTWGRTPNALHGSPPQSGRIVTGCVWGR
jgi:predicted phage terminase large subunit-like protein